MLERPSLDVHGVMNNNSEDQVQRNGRTLIRAMKEQRTNVASLLTPR